MDKRRRLLTSDNFIIIRIFYLRPSTYRMSQRESRLGSAAAVRRRGEVSSASAGEGGTRLRGLLAGRQRRNAGLGSVTATATATSREG